MEYRFSLNPTFESVFLINGKLIEGGEIICASDGVAYITILPLSAVLLPYTVKMVGCKVKSNPELCKCYRLDSDKYYLKLLPRYNYVYSVTPEVSVDPADLVDKFFICVRAGKIEDARGCLSPDLSQSIDDHSLIAFFDDFVDLVASDCYGNHGVNHGGNANAGAGNNSYAGGGQYYLINKDGSGVLYSFIIKNGVIDNIIEL